MALVRFARRSPSHPPSFPRRRKSTSQYNGKLQLKNRIPACAGMTRYLHISNPTSIGPIRVSTIGFERATLWPRIALG
jgi:hypothetical protein